MVQLLSKPCFLLFSAAFFGADTPRVEKQAQKVLKHIFFSMTEDVEAPPERGRFPYSFSPSRFA
jgi:hypothetical protein